MALEAASATAYLRCYLFEAYVVPDTGLPVASIGKDHIPTLLDTDCKSVYDNSVKDAPVPSDRLVAIAEAALRGTVSGVPQRDQKKTQLRLVPTRWQLADGLTRPG